MIFFKINSKSLTKNPTLITTTKTPIQSSDRTMDGTMVIDIIAIKDVVSVEWAVLGKDDMLKLKNETKDGGFVSIDYWDMDTSQMKNITALPSNITYAPFYDYSTDSVMWKDVKITFTEQ